MKTKIITLLAVMGIAATALLISCSEKSVTQDFWQQPFAKVELTKLSDECSGLFAQAASSDPISRSDGEINVTIKELERVVSVFAEKYDVTDQVQKSGYYPEKLDEESTALIASNVYAFSDYVKINGTRRFAQIIGDFAESGEIGMSRQSIIDDQNMLLAEKITLILMQAVPQINTQNELPTRGDTCYESYLDRKNRCGKDCLNSVGGNYLAGMTGGFLGVAAATFVSFLSVNRMDDCIDDAWAAYEDCVYYGDR